MEKYLERDEIMEKEEWGADQHLITWFVRFLSFSLLSFLLPFPLPKADEPTFGL